MAVYDITEDECTSSERSIAEEPRVHGLIGIGQGNQIFTIPDKTYMGKFWIWGKYEVDNGFLDSDGLLVEDTLEKFVNQITDFQWAITTKRRITGIRAGDFIKFHSKNSGIEELSTATISRDSDGNLKLELGARRPTRADAHEAEQDVGYGYDDSYISESHKNISGVSNSSSSDTRDFYPTDDAHVSTGGSIRFWIPGSILDDDLIPRVTMKLSVDADSSLPLTFGACALELKKSGDYLRGGSFIGWTPGADLPDIDVTDWLTARATPIYDGLSGSADLDLWPSSGEYMVEIEVSTRTGATDTVGSIELDDETVSINGADTYSFSTVFTEKPEMTITGLDCNLKIYLLQKNVISIGVTMAEEYPETHSSYKGHPKLSASATLYCWKRQDRS